MGHPQLQKRMQTAGLTSCITSCITSCTKATFLFWFFNEIDQAELSI